MKLSLSSKFEGEALRQRILGTRAIGKAWKEEGLYVLGLKVFLLAINRLKLRNLNKDWLRNGQNIGQRIT